MKRKNFISLVLLIILGVQLLPAQGLLKTEGQQIVNAEGENIQLKGMGLGGWMLQEGYMLKVYNNGTQHSIKARIQELIGKEECDRFYSLWLQNHMTKADVDSLAHWGFNSIRLPMHFNLFTLPVDEEPVKGENTWLQKGFDLTDSLVSWCKANRVYLILDLHAAPGGQGNDVNISDRDTAKPSLWQSEENKQKTIALWKRLAAHYVNEPVIAGYDLINEPNWTFEGKHKNGTEDTLNKPIWDLYIEITKAIREVDNNHIIFIEGNGWGNNYRGFPGSWDNNMVLSFHKYWNTNDQASIQNFIDLRNKYNMPLWLGETGENSNKWFTDCIRLMDKNNIGWAWWPLKKIGSTVCPLMIKTPENYDSIVNYWNKNTARPSKEVASKALFQVIENMKNPNCRYNKDIIDAMFRQVKDSTTKAFTINNVPGRIYASDYDLGYTGVAYQDFENENNGQPGKKGGNKFHQYRNDGVDIQSCNDIKEETNGFDVYSIDNGEWMQYTVNVAKAGVYNISARVSAVVDYAEVQLECNKKLDTKIITIPELGAADSWQNVSLSKLTLQKGENQIKIHIKKGGFKLNYLEIK